jgi:predicted permease
MQWQYFFGSRKKAREIGEELESHLRMAMQDRIDRGESPQNARRAALREFGNAALVQETTREVWVWTAIEHLFQDVRIAARILTKSPAFSAAAVTLIALGIGGNTTIFSMVNAILIKSMPGVSAGNLISLGKTIDGHVDDPGDSYPNYADYAAQTKTLSLLARGYERFTLVLDKASYGLHGALVTGNYFETAAVHLAKGRAFTADESRSDASGLAAVISHRLWQDVFQGAENVLGRTISLNGHPATIIGVAPPQFRGLQIGEHNDIWVPLLNYARMHGIEGAFHERDVTDARGVEMVGRLAPGATLAQARAEFAIISKRLEAAFPKANKGRAVLLEPYSAIGSGITFAERFMKILMVVAMLALLIVCANVANLMLSRAAFRQREMAVRQSLGASRNRIFRMLVAEGLVLSLIALFAAWIFALWAAHAIARLIPSDGGQTLDLDFAPDWRVAAYAMLLALLSTLAFTLAPAVRAWRQDLLPWLKAGQTGVAQGRSKLSSVLAITQLGLCVVLLTGAGLAYRSHYLLNTFDPHLSKDHLLLVTVRTDVGANSREANTLLIERLREHLGAAPGVVAVSYALIPPLRGGRAVGPVQSSVSQQPFPAEGNVVGPDYFRALGVVPLRGREFSEDDRAIANQAVIINQNLADTLWPGRLAVGQTMLLGPTKQAVEVIGIVPNGYYSGLWEGTRHNFVFQPERQSPAAPGEMTFHIRYAGSLDAIAPAIRAAVHETDMRVPVFYMRTMETQWQEITGPSLFITTLLSLFAAGALVLAAIGLYAVIAFNMSRRTRDFGIRMALGASSGQILTDALREGLLLTAVGLSIGFGLSLAAGKALGSLLFGVTPTDLLTYLAVFAVLAVVSLTACYLPARRAALIDPMQALRQE